VCVRVCIYIYIHRGIWSALTVLFLYCDVIKSAFRVYDVIKLGFVVFFVPGR